MPIRLVLQRVQRARLLLDNENEWGTIHQGVLIFLAFLKPVESPLSTDQISALQTKVGDDKQLMKALLSALPSNTVEFDENHIDKAVKAITSVKVCPNGEDGKPVGLSECAADVMVVPQASMGGILKGKAFQHHRNLEKDVGEKAYSMFVSKLEDALKGSSPSRSVVCGTYGNRQALDIESAGPMSRFFEI
eukprot:GFYU01015318.1.p1 GENE.GFYU01015318.1~~GFYU01015318.1.p1  ORF type:complete len:206 (+),score=29.09 GFYU01015318.1:46-618(+)